MKNWGNLGFNGFSSMSLTCITRKISMTVGDCHINLSLTSGKRRVTTLGFPRERRAKAFGMQSHTLTILCGVRSMGNEWDCCRLPKCRETTEADKLLLAVWKDAGHIKKAGVSFSFLPFKKQYSGTPLVNSQ